MPTYIGLMKLTHAGSKDIINLPAQIEDATKLYQKMGGKVIGVYMVMGEYDFITVGECPSDDVQVAFSLALMSQGNVKTTTLKAYTAKEIPAILGLMPKP